MCDLDKIIRRFIYFSLLQFLSVIELHLAYTASRHESKNLSFIYNIISLFYDFIISFEKKKLMHQKKVLDKGGVGRLSFNCRQKKL